MAYVQPTTVLSPRNKVRSVDVLYDSGKEDGWAVARLNWMGDIVLGIRWNGSEESSLGTPNARGVPTWFVVPEELETAILERVEEISNRTRGGLLDGYTEMANDQTREREAEEWSEGLIGDASAQG